MSGFYSFLNRFAVLFMAAIDVTRTSVSLAAGNVFYSHWDMAWKFSQ